MAIHSIAATIQRPGKMLPVTFTDFDRSKDYVSVASLPVTYNKCGVAKINTKNLGNVNFSEPIITYNGLAISGVQWNPRQIYKPPICVGTTQYVHGDNATMTTIP
jgi:hypothetical protein